MLWRDTNKDNNIMKLSQGSMFAPFVLGGPHCRAVLGRHIVNSIYHSLERSDILIKNEGFCSQINNVAKTARARSF